MKVQRMSQISILITFIVVVLILGQNLFVPIVLAIFVWFIIREIRQLFDRIRFVREKIPSWLVNLISTIGLFFILGFIVSLITSNINSLSRNTELYEKNLRLMVMMVNEKFHVDVLTQIRFYQGELNVSRLLSEIINTVSSVFGNIFIILIYILFILIEESGFQTKMNAFYSVDQHREHSRQILLKIDNSIGQYLFLKTLVSFITALASFIVLMIIGVNGAFFWAFIIFVLNFIPTIGSLIASLFPAAFALLQFGEIGPSLWVLAIIGLIQVVVGNLLEPKIMGNSLNLSGLVVLLSLSVWGAIWGIVGMALSVPITVILLILFAEFPQTRPIAILLSEKGKLNT